MKRTVSVQCGHKGCKEWAHYEADNKKNESRLYAKYGGGKYRCNRHTRMEEILSTENLKTEKTYISGKSKTYPELKELYWTGGCGVAYGPGFKAYAGDFPIGTKIIVTAELIIPGEEAK